MLNRQISETKSSRSSVPPKGDPGHKKRSDSQEKPDVPQQFPALPVTFKKGLIGFADYHDYGLMELPDSRLSQFRLLQSVDDADLAFLLLPLDKESGVITRSDIDKALDTLGLAKADALLFAVVTLRMQENTPSLTANLRAPVIIDLNQQIGFQHVFANPDYDIRYALR